MIISRNKRTNIFLMVGIGMLSVFLAFILVRNPFFATAAASGSTDSATKAVGAVFSVIKIICDIGGIFLIVGGIVKYAIAHANQQGPDEMKAFQWIIAGIVLALLGFVLLDTIGLEKIITDAIKDSATTTP